MPECVEAEQIKYMALQEILVGSCQFIGEMNMEKKKVITPDKANIGQSTNDVDLLKFALENGIINKGYVQEIYNMKRRSELLEMHEGRIWEASDGKWKTYLPDKDKGRRLIKRATRRELEDVICDFWREKSENPTLIEVFEEWNDRRLQLKKIQESTHLRNQQIFRRHFSEFGYRKIKSMPSEEILEFMEEQIPKYNLTSKAFGNLKSIVKGMFRRAKRRKLITFNIEDVLLDIDLSETEFKKVVKEDYEEVFSDDEQEIMMSYLLDNLDMTNLAIILMFISGARVGEIVALKHSDFSDNSFNIRRTETRYIGNDGVYVYDVKEFPKTQAGVRTIVIPSSYLWIMNEIKNTNPNGEYVFEKDKKRISTYVPRMRLSRLCRKLGIYKKSPHKIRKTYGTILLDNNVDKRMIMDQMGHTDIRCTENHYHRNRKSYERKINILDNVPEFKKENLPV